MTVSKTSSAAVYGVNAYEVEVEVNLAPTGGINYTTVGLPDAAVRESQERVLAALGNAGFDTPIQKITVNLAPADIRKEGSTFDLPIALAILMADDIIRDEIAETMIMGELSLDGRVKPVKGALSAAILAGEMGKKRIILPERNAREAAVVNGPEVIGVSSLPQAIEYLTGNEEIEPTCIDVAKIFESAEHDGPDFSEVRGQAHVKRALEVAAAGGHNMLMIGPPGSGKSMMAKRIPSILPDMSFDEAIETTRIHSVSGKLDGAALVTRRPFRAPHHTISDAGLIGGGTVPTPGEISLSHNGVLFLDEFPEFKRNTLEALRGPLEDGEVTISRATMSVTFPARMMLAAAMNPCPCGYYTDPARECVCTLQTIRKYRSRISGPLMDRIDIHVEAPAVKFREMMESKPEEPSCAIRARVNRAREAQMKRFDRNAKTYCNAQMGPKQIRTVCKLDATCHAILRAAVEKLGLSARAHEKIMKVARTIADLDGATDISAIHLSEAVQYRSLDREIV